MSDEIVFYTNPMSRGRIVRWMLEEVGNRTAPKIVEYANNKSPEYLAINPMGKVPALTHGRCGGDRVRGDLRLSRRRLPRGRPRAAAREHRPGALLSLAVLRRRADRGGDDQQSPSALSFRPAARRMVGYGTHETVLDVMEQAVTGSDYIAGGNKFSAADVYFGSQIAFGLQFGSMEARPAFVA